MTSCEIQELLDCLWQIHGHHVWYLHKLDVIEPWDKRWPALSSWALGNAIVWSCHACSLIILRYWLYVSLNLITTQATPVTRQTETPPATQSSVQIETSLSHEIHSQPSDRYSTKNVSSRIIIISEDPTLMEEFTILIHIIIYAEAK